MIIAKGITMILKLHCKKSNGSAEGILVNMSFVEEITNFSYESEIEPFLRFGYFNYLLGCRSTLWSKNFTSRTHVIESLGEIHAMLNTDK